LSLEADCMSDVRATHPLAAELLHGLVFDELSAPAGMAPPVPIRAVPDPPTAAGLRAWGVVTAGGATGK